MREVSAKATTMDQLCEDVEKARKDEIMDREKACGQAGRSLCREIDELVQHGIGVDPSNLTMAISDMIDARIRLHQRIA